MRIERRPTPRNAALYRIGAVVLGLVVALLVAPLFGDVPAGTFYDFAWTGTFGSTTGVSNVLTLAVPLILAGLAAAIPFKVGLWNVGIDGQILVGAWAATGVSFLLDDLAGPLLIPLMFLVAMAGGALWILIPALARIYLGVSEIITTFLLNFAASAWMLYWVTGPWKDPNSAGGGVRGRPVPEQSQLSLLDLDGALVHWGLLIALALPIAVWATLRFTRVGYDLSIVGASERTGRYAGLDVRRRLIATMLVGGAIGGLAGTIDMMGTLHQLGSGLTNNTGFNGLVIAVLAGSSAIGVLVLGVIYAALLSGGDAVGIAGAPSTLVFAAIGFTLMAGALGEAVARLRVVRTRDAEERPPGAVASEAPG